MQIDGPASDDLDRILHFLLEFADMMLREEGQFHPFGTGLTADRRMSSAPPRLSVADPSPEEIVAAVYDSLTAEAAAKTIEGSGICTAVTVVPPGADHPRDAICVELEHRDGTAVEVFVPYEIVRPGVIAYGESFMTRGEPSIFLSVEG